jgi:hypothetical protein
MKRIYVYLCPETGKAWETDEDRGEVTECPEHHVVHLRKEGSYIEE